MRWWLFLEQKISKIDNTAQQAQSNDAKTIVFNRI